MGRGVGTASVHSFREGLDYLRRGKDCKNYYFLNIATAAIMAFGLAPRCE